MVNKSFSIYGEGKVKAGAEQQVILEVGKSHLVCFTYDINNATATAFELFDFKEEDSRDFQQLFSTILPQSKLLPGNNQSVKVFINHEFCLPVPTFKFNKDIATDYLDIAFGSIQSTIVKYDHLAINPDIINIYKVAEDCHHTLTKDFSKIAFQHTYSSIIRNVATANAKSASLLSVFFYNTHMIVVVMKDDRFSLAQSIDYETGEDVVYFLLNLAERLGLNKEQLTVMVTGMINLDFNLYRELIKYFKNVQVDDNTPIKTTFAITDYPSHYFNPFFKLAV
jgi:hypothetical protein